MACGHLAARRREGVDARLEALEEPRAQQPRRLQLEGLGVGVAEPVGRGSVAGQRELLAVLEGVRGRQGAVLGLHVRPEGVGETLEEARQNLVQLVLLAQHGRLGEGDRHLFAAHADALVGVEALDEAAGPPDRHGVQDVEELVRREVVWVLGRSLGEVLPQGRYPGLHERPVVADEVGEEVVEVPEGVVDGGGREQDHLLRRGPGEELAQPARPVSLGVAVGVSLIDDDHGVVVGVLAQDLVAGSAEGWVPGQLLVGDDLYAPEEVVVEELFPRPVPERRRGHE